MLINYRRTHLSTQRGSTHLGQLWWIIVVSVSSLRPLCRGYWRRTRSRVSSTDLTTMEKLFLHIPGKPQKAITSQTFSTSPHLTRSVFYCRFVELLDETSKPLRIQRHQVLDQNNSPVELCSGVETKGILGNDGRPYILDLLRTFPPDLNFHFSETKVRSEDVPKVCQRFGYPRRHHHNLANLRPELIEAFVQHR